MQPAHPGDFLGHRFLLVEDNTDHALLTRMALLRSGAATAVEVCEDATAALEWLADPQHGADAVLVDLRLPGMGGLELVERLAHPEEGERLPVFVLSTSAREEEIAEAYRRGARGFLTKPLEVSELLRQLETESSR